MTGVGIWFAIGLANPEATSLLIHQYVFAWATEWVAFVGELTLLYLYYYGWKKNPHGEQVFLAGAYFVVSWFSLVIINGILSFMLTPGGWTLENKDIAAGFFNPSYWPTLILRTVVMFLLGGLGGILVAGKLSEDDPIKPRVVRLSAAFAIPAAVLVPILFYWYWSVLPANTTKLVQEGITGLGGTKLSTMARAVALAGISAGTLLVGLLVVVYKARTVTLGAGIALMVIAQLGIMGGEFFREMARKPYVIYGTLYSNSLWKHEADKGAQVLSKPYLERAKWHPAVKPLSKEHGE